MNSKQQVKRKVSLLRVQIAVNFILNPSIIQPRTHVSGYRFQASLHKGV